MKKIRLSVGEFALPVPRKGSIEVLSGYGKASQTGIEAHQRIQAKRAAEFPHYQSEIPVSHTFQVGDYEFEIGGRLDGFFDAQLQKPAHIEEIKTTFSLKEISYRLAAAPDEHPYCLQLKTYGYFHFLKTGKVPDLSFLLVSTRNWETETMKLPLHIESFEAFLKLRLEELVEEAKASEKRALRRKKISKMIAFPFPKPRAGQLELIATIEEGMQQNRRMMIQAPTGLGKTVGVLYPTLKEAMSRGQKLVYVTPKNSQHSVAEEAIAKLQEKGSPLKSLTLTAKSKICFKAEALCNPQYCEYAKDHYTKVAEHKVIEQLGQKKKLTAKVFRKIAAEYEVCPFEIQLDAAKDVDAVICDYNYVFAPRSAYGRLTQTGVGGLEQEGQPNLVIDEAHNLPARAMDYYSPSLSTAFLQKLADDTKNIPIRFRKECKELVAACIDVVKMCRPPTKGAAEAGKIDPPAGLFLLQEQELRAFLSKYLDSDVDIKSGDPVLRLAFYWSEFTAALEFVRDRTHKEFFTTYQPLPEGGVVKITCCDAGHRLSESYDDFDQVVGFSATLKPFSFYSQLTGLKSKDLKTAEFTSPFAKKNRKLMIIPQVSSKYAQRDKSAPRIAEIVEKVAALKPGNYFVFFPSFDFLEKVYAQFKTPAGFRLLRQERYTKPEQVETMIEELKQPDLPTLVFAVQGGVFSEGVDYPGKMIIGAFVIGPPLPSFDIEREEMRAYYDSIYQSGFDYAYTYPAMAKAVQSAGRVIRSETDKGIIVLIDGRFLHDSYAKSMPQDWFERSAMELVPKKIIQEVTDFWKQSP